MKTPVDIVIPWVDGNDPKWIEEHDKYSADKISDNHVSRYRAWDTFKYWFRAIEENAPWIRKIHFITWGHFPEWLNLDSDKLHIVNHKDFIPEKYLPTFSSHVIEMNLHRIPDLAENFIYFNDDVYLNSKVNSEDFFLNGVPRDSAILGVIKNNHVENFMPYIMLNMMALINMNFDNKDVIKKDKSKWFNLKYGKYIFNNLYLYPFNCFTGFRNFHGATAFCKKTFIEVWDKFPDTLDEVCSHKFRSKSDVNQYLFRYWQLVNGNFEPIKPSSEYFTIGKVSAKEIEHVISDAKIRVLCINDDPGDFDIEEEQRKIDSAFKKRYGKKSSFEK